MLRVRMSQNSPIDLSGNKEGKFAIPVPEMIDLLNKLLSYEYQAFLSYTHYAQILRLPYRESITKIFDEHADEELDHATKVARRISALGGITTVIPQPVPSATTLEEMIPNLVAQEQEAIYLYRNALTKCGENEGTRQMIETILEKEQEHADELWLLIPRSADQVVAYLDKRLEDLFGKPFLREKLDPKTILAASNLGKILKKNLANPEKFEIKILSENPKRIVYDIAKVKEGDSNSICRVTKNCSPKIDWACSCLGSSLGMCSHTTLVKKWEDSGRRGLWQDAAYRIKRFMDSLEGKGEKKSLKSVMHKPLPHIRKPDGISEPKGEPNFVVEEKGENLDANL